MLAARRPEPALRRSIPGRYRAETVWPRGRRCSEDPHAVVQVRETTLSEATRQAVLSRELSELLVELSIGVHRFVMYPPGHPSLAPVVDSIIGRLAILFERRETLSIGVAERQLVIEGVATDQKHPVLSDLAGRLHDHHLGAISFSRGVTATEVTQLLEALARDNERGAIPLGLLPADDLPRWQHARLYRVGYEKLELRGAGGAGSMDRATALWLGLAQAALAIDDATYENDPGLIARTIERSNRDAAYDQVIVGYLRQLTEELGGSRGKESETIRKRLASLLNELDDTALARLIGRGTSLPQRHRFLLDANQALSVDSVIKLVRAAASASGQTISTSMTRLLRKLSVHAEQGGAEVRSQADTALRENVEALIADWELEDPNPEAYTTILDELSRSSPVLAPRQGADDLSSPERMLQMALEVDSYGPTVARAVSAMMARGDAGQLVELIGRAPAGNQLADRVRGHLTSPNEFRRIVAGEQIDERAMRSLVEQMGSAAVDPLLDVLAESDSRSVRRRVFDVLVHLGPFVAQRAIERMEDGRWFVIRNMLALLQRLEHVPADFDPQKYLEHEDARVRREALPLAIRTPRLRNRALVAALGDADERMVRMALLEMQESVPEAVVPTLVNRVVAPSERSSEIRALGAKALSGSRSPLALKALLELVGAGRSFFGKTRIDRSSPEVVAAVWALARGWSDADEARPMLEAADASKDPAIRGAARAGVKAAQEARAG